MKRIYLHSICSEYECFKFPSKYLCCWNQAHNILSEIYPITNTPRFISSSTKVQRQNDDLPKLTHNS